MSSIPPQAFAASLAGFGEMTVHRLLALLRHHPPELAFAIAAGDEPPPAGGLIAHVLAEEAVRDAWRRSARRCDPGQMWQRCLDLGLTVTVLGDPDHPGLLAHDPLPPPVLFSAGDRELLAGRRVAIVGTRNATAAGRHVARQFGYGLVQAGVHVVSGLARGIDGQAHQGALVAVDEVGAAGRPVAVVASGLDVIYPKEHTDLWQRVTECGLVLSEAPPGSPPVAYRFPLRNRIIAGLSEVVVVVESRERGGSLITAAAALERDVPVMAVPGHAASRASLGVNALLRDGSAPALDVDDVLLALHLDHGHTLGLFADRRARPRSSDVAAYRLCAARACTVGEVSQQLDVPILDAAMMVARLEQSGWLVQVDGWFEAAGSPLR